VSCVRWTYLTSAHLRLLLCVPQERHPCHWRAQAQV
jgi:hypothetical protein